MSRREDCADERETAAQLSGLLGGVADGVLDGVEGRSDAALGKRTESIGAIEAAPSAMVNRTHRVIGERARAMRARRSKTRSLWIPLTVSAGLLGALTVAVWSVLAQYEATPNGLPDSGQQMWVLMMWCLPLSVVLLAVVCLRSESTRSRKEAGR